MDISCNCLKENIVERRVYYEDDKKDFMGDTVSASGSTAYCRKLL